MSSPTTEEDEELSAALGWPGGISDPILDRAALLRLVASATVELASMRTCFEAADRERSELRADAERYRYVLKHARRIDICGLSISQTSMCQLSARIDAERRNA